MRVHLSHNDKFATRDIYWSSSSPLISCMDVMHEISGKLDEFGYRVVSEKNSFKIVHLNGLVVFGIGLGSTGGRLVISDNAVATVFMLSIIDRMRKQVIASYDDGQELNPMKIGPEDLVARHPDIGLVFATRLMLAVGLIGGVSIASQKKSPDELIHSFC